MTLRTNCWLTIELALAQTWKVWYNWAIGDRQEPEPPLSNWDKNAIAKKIIDKDFSFQAFKKATIAQLAPKDRWVMISLYDISHGNIEAGFNQHGEATQGGDLGVAGYWTWKRGDALCQYDHTYPWYPSQVVKFMPDECAAFDESGNCTATQPASQISDVSLLYTQPRRHFPEQP